MNSDADITCKFCREVTLCIFIALGLGVLGCVGFLVWALIEFARYLP